jgi:hypothetical protein
MKNMSAAVPHAPPEQRVYWHRELPPLSAEVESEHVVEAESQRVPNHFGDRDALWAPCYDDLKLAAERRIVQELERKGGWCARVADEDVHSRVNDAEGTYWLVGRFTYVQYNRPSRG